MDMALKTAFFVLLWIVSNRRRVAVQCHFAGGTDKSRPAAIADRLRVLAVRAGDRANVRAVLGRVWALV